MILASAGTGKTFELSSRYIRLLIDGFQPESILATTFTKKAAGEILDRIVLRMARAADDEKVAETTAKELGRPETTRGQFAELLSQLIDHLNNLQVQTLDAFFAKITRAFSLDMGLPPDWTANDEGAVDGLKSRAIRQSLSQKSTLTIVHDLGKGEAQRSVSKLVRQAVNDLYEIYRETLDQGTTDAWQKLQPQDRLTEPEIDELFHILSSVKLNGTDAYKKTIIKDIQKVADRDWDEFLKNGVSKKAAMNDRFLRNKEIQADVFEPLRKLSRHILAEHINLLVRQTQGAYAFLQTYHQRFQELKIDNALLEFNDVAYLAWRLFKEQPFRKIAWRLDQQIDHLLLDEFQDTSVQQWQILKPIAERVCMPGNERSFFCVGDIKQAIYGWRGGVSAIFDEVRGQLGSSLDSEEKRSKSYRSSPVIIDTVNDVFENLMNHKELKDRKHMYQSWTEEYQHHETVHTTLPGYASFENTTSKDNHYAESARRIAELAKQNPEHSVGVLVRNNKDLASVIFYLGRLGVPASEEGGNPLIDSAAVNIILSALRLVDHPDDSISRFHLLQTPLAQLFGLTIENFKSHDIECRNAAQQIRLQLFAGGYGDLITEWAELLEADCTAREWFRVCQLIERGYMVSTADHLRTADFIGWIERNRVSDPSASQIRVMTIHKSKGLEFDIVVLPDIGFNRGQAPRYVVGRDTPTSPIHLVCHYMNELKREWLPDEFIKAFDDTIEGQIHEMLSVIYVALTRSRHALHMIAEPEIQRSQKCAAGLIMSALDIEYSAKKDQPGSVLWEKGDPNWSRTLRERDTDEQTTAATNDKPVAVVRTQGYAELNFAPSKSNRNLPWESPSSREGGQQVTLGRLLRLEDNQDARIHGSLIHACFEHLTWLDEPIPSDKILTEKLQQVEGASTASIKHAISAFRKMLRRPNTAKLLRRDQFNTDLFNTYDEFWVENERPFAVRIGATVSSGPMPGSDATAAFVSGYIDRLVLLVREGRVVAADVVDFKTDSLAKADHEALQKRIDVYRPQILSYGDAVATMYDLEREEVSCRLMFVDLDLQVPIA